MQHTRLQSQFYALLHISSFSRHGRIVLSIALESSRYLHATKEGNNAKIGYPGQTESYPRDEWNNALALDVPLSMSGAFLDHYS